MPTRADVTRLARGQRRISDYAADDLRRLVASFDMSSPELVRDALLEVVPQLVHEYGDLAATAAAEWYEEVRDAPGVFHARLGGEAAVEAVTENVRFAARHLFTDEPIAVLGAVSGAMQRFITYSGRDTVLENVRLDSSRPMFARVPAGVNTCAFCELVASRGFAYYSKEAAGAVVKYHDHCNCQIVPSWDAEAAHIAGYDPDAMYDRYLVAARVADGGSPSDVLAAMRREFPGHYTDGVYDD